MFEQFVEQCVCDLWARGRVGDALRLMRAYLAVVRATQ